MSGPHSVLQPAGPHAESVLSLFGVFTLVSTLVFVTVLAVLGLALVRGMRRAAAATDAATERTQRIAVSAAVAGTALVLFALLVADFATARRIAGFNDPAGLTVELIGQQWWWEVHYEDSVPARRVTTANELRIPVGVTVRVKTRSRDVIHSFWAPNLNGKRDLIPGYTGSVHLRADRPGIFRAQCAEYCGVQHAHMGLVIVAQPPDSFAAWIEAQRRPAEPPTDSLRAAGLAVFLGSPCATCHSIRGTPARGRAAPDLTHFASRLTLAAGARPNTRGFLAGWILDPQSIKPGNRMHATLLSGNELHALLAYLEGLHCWPRTPW